MTQFYWTTKSFLSKATQLISFCVLGLLLQPAAAQDTSPAVQTFHAEYNAYRSGMKLGKATQTLEQQHHNTYVFRYQSKASFLFLSDKRKEESHFDLTNGVITPISYTFSRSGTGKDKSLELSFDAQQQLIQINREKTIPWQGELDNQLYQLKIKKQLAQGQQEFVFQTINDRGELREQGFEVIANEKLILPYGEIEAIKIQKKRKDSKRQTFIWLAPSLNYQMVRIQQFKKGEEQLDIQLRYFKTI